MEITLSVNDGINVVPKYYGYTGGFSNITRCEDCKSTGLYEDQPTANCCKNCGGKINYFGSGKYDEKTKKWLCRYRC